MIEKLLELQKNAYVPYSKYPVSAIVVTKDGREFNGVNVEDASTRAGTCAERTAIFYANSQYPHNKILTMAISAFYDGKIINQPITPCGACRQVILETEKRFSQPIKIILSSSNKCLIINSVKDILPLDFDSSFFD